MHFELLTSANKFINGNQITEMRVMFHQSAARVQKTRTLPDISRPAEAFITHALCCAFKPVSWGKTGSTAAKSATIWVWSASITSVPPTPHLYRETVCGGCPWLSSSWVIGSRCSTNVHKKIKVQESSTLRKEGWLSTNFPLKYTRSSSIPANLNVSTGKTITKNNILERHHPKPLTKWLTHTDYGGNISLFVGENPSKTLL